MVRCQQDCCQHFTARTDTFEGQELIIGYYCKHGFDIELNKLRGYERNVPFCERYERMKDEDCSQQ
ncbi:hypothetical protein U14_05461 [Candidatus Moduliflexus flocculans]|uniref:Uncharacterized protein n=1 Tax=Candidatus Moduliflexus flocculans TaxID=1499966 RepID=A0A081BS01_9BACT|nr:hypothetical protein U14_05461 [Candidatus Moduliflexus flocculans]